MVEELFHDTHPDTCPDDPSLRQDHLQALALIALVENHTTGETSGGGRPDVIVVVDETTLQFGPHTNTILDWGDPDTALPVETLRRMACLANIVPVVLNGAGIALDVGRDAGWRHGRNAVRCGRCTRHVGSPAAGCRSSNAPSTTSATGNTAARPT